MHIFFLGQILFVGLQIASSGNICMGPDRVLRCVELWLHASRYLYMVWLQTTYTGIDEHTVGRFLSREAAAQLCYASAAS